MKILSRVGATIGIMTLSVVPAHAGGQGGGGTSEIALDCHNIRNAVLQNQLVTINGGTETLVVNNGALLCTTTQVSKGDLSAFAGYTPTPGAWKCYNVTAVGNQGPPQAATLEGPFGTENVSVAGSRYLCTGVQE
jgi:hypothetical protein